MSLEYMGRALTPEPSNVSLHEAAQSLDLGRSVYVCLEPGDATRYDLLLTPFNGIRRGEHKIGLPTWNENTRHLVVTRLVDMRPAFSAVIWEDCWEGEYQNLATYGGQINEWTHELLQWWFTQLWEALS